MPVFSITQLRKPKKGAGASTAYNSVMNTLKVLDLEYKNPFNDKIMSEEYFIETEDIIMAALKNSAITPIKKADLAVALLSNRKEQETWKVESAPQFTMTTDKIEETLEDNWRSLWKNKDLLRSGNVQAMAAGMVGGGEDSINSMLGQLEEVESLLSDIPGSEDKLRTVRKTMDFLEDKGDFWRGVAGRPEEYAILADTTANGEIKNFEVKNIANTSGYKDTGTKMGGFALYGKPHPSLTDEDGLQTIAIGNNIFRGDKTFDFMGEGEFDLTSLRNVPFGNYPSGTVLSSVDNKFKVMQQDGNLISYDNKEELEKAGYSADGAVAMDSDDDAEINSMYSVSTPKQLETKANTQERLDAIRQQYEDQTGFYNYLKGATPEEVGATYGEAAGLLGKAGAELTKTVPEAAKGFVKAGGELAGTVPELFKKSLKTNIEAFKKQGKRIGEAGRIFKGMFGGNK